MQPRQRGAASGEHSSDVAARLRDAGLRATRPRQAVLRHLLGHRGHWTVDEIVANLASAQVTLPRQTVYNVVDDLSRAGLLMTADVGPGSTRYEAADEWHHHFICTRCGRVQDVACAAGVKPCLDVDVDGAEVEEAQIILRGVCARCRR